MIVCEQITTFKPLKLKIGDTEIPIDGIAARGEPEAIKNALEKEFKMRVVKEFAKKLKSKKTVYDNGGDGDLRVAVPIECIDELLKEYEK
mgnify:CR=1 FL=1